MNCSTHLYSTLAKAFALTVLGAPALAQVPGSHTLRVVDIDGDGRLDRLEASPDGTLTVSLNLGERQFQSIELELPAVSIASVLCDDLNGDGKLDLYLVSPDSNVALIGDGSGGFHEATAELGLTDPSPGMSAERVDIDGDGYSDILLRNEGADVIFWGHGTGVFERDPRSVVEPRGSAAETVQGGGTDSSVSAASAEVEDRNGRTGGISRRAGSSLSGSGSRIVLTPTAVGTAERIQHGFGDNLGNHTATQNLELNGNYLSGDGGNEGVSVDSSGSVGIGTTTPSDKLHIVDGRIQISHSSNSPALFLVDDADGSDWSIHHARGADRLEFRYDDNSVKMAIDDAGNVGIGTTSPTEALDVDDTIRSRSGGVEFPDGSTQVRAVDLYFTGESLDQEQALITNFATATGVWQSFTPESSGTLSRVEVFRAIGAGSATLRIYDGEGIGGTLLATEVLPAAFSSDFQAVAFSNPPTVVAGSLYTIRVNDAGGPTLWGHPGDKPYFGGGSNFFFFGATVDMTFRTYVSQTGPVLSLHNTGAAVPENGLIFPGSQFAANSSFVGTPGNFLSFGHEGVSEDSIGYRNNTFYFHDSPGGGDAQQPNVIVRGRLGVAMTGTPNFDLHVNGSAGKPGGGSWSAASDLRLKKNVADLENALDTLLKLRGVTFEHKDPEAINELSGVRTGFIAQEIEEILPDWVEEADDGYKRVVIRGFEALAVEALRELHAELAELRESNAELRQRIDHLRIN